MIEKGIVNNRINTDWQFRCAPLPAGYAKRYAIRKSTAAKGNSY